MKRRFLAGLLAGLVIGYISHKQVVLRQKEYVFTTVRDTVTIVRPVPVAAVPETVRVETVRLLSAAGDSVAARVPFTSVVYAGEGYRARVSGFRPSLDSLVFERAVVTPLPRPKRWAVGIQAGIAATPKGVQPFVGIGVTYKLYEF